MWTLPAVANQTRAFDFIDWNNPDNDAVSGQLVKIVRDWLSTGELVIPDKINEKPNSDVEALLKELENPETRPRRRSKSATDWRNWAIRAKALALRNMKSLNMRRKFSGCWMN